MQPFVRKIDKRELQDYQYPVCFYDFSMTFVIHGVFKVQTDDREYILNSNDIFIAPPAAPHQITGLTEERSIYWINYDIDRSHYYLPVIHPEPAQFFDEASAIIPDNKEEMQFRHYIGCDFAKDGFRKILNEFKNNDIYSEEINGLILHQILLECKRTNTNKTSGIISQVIKYINNNYSKKISNKLIADTFGYHPTHLNKLFTEHTGTTIHKYVTECKLKEARRLLIHTNKSIAEISYIVGFEYPEYFAKVHYDYFATTPTQYRRQYPTPLKSD